MRRLTILLAAMGALLLLPAAQAFANGTLTVSIAGTGSGEVSSAGGYYELGFWEGSPAIECTGPPATGVCENELEEYEEEPGVEAVALHAITAAGSEFAGWEVTEGTDYGELCENFNDPSACIPSVESGAGNAAVTVYFECETEGGCEGAPEQPLTLKINSGEGTVVSNPAGITCTGSAGEECTSEFEEGSEVTLTASPASGYRFYNWAACPGTATGRQCKVTMSAAKEAKVNFKKSWQLTASKAAGSQPGIVKVLPTGVTCPYKCLSSSYEFLDGQEVTVDRYEPNGQLHFTEFTGGTGSAATCNGATTPCSFTLEADSSIEALFEANAQATLSLQKEGGGQAKITSAPAGIYCFNTCDQASSQFYSEPSAEEVTLSWTLGAGTTSLEWSTGAGTCTGVKTANGSCKVTMDEAHELVATLE